MKLQLEMDSAESLCGAAVESVTHNDNDDHEEGMRSGDGCPCADMDCIGRECR